MTRCKALRPGHRKRQPEAAHKDLARSHHLGFEIVQGTVPAKDTRTARALLPRKAPGPIQAAAAIRNCWEMPCTVVHEGHIGRAEGLQERGRAARHILILTVGAVDKAEDTGLEAGLHTETPDTPSF